MSDQYETKARELVIVHVDCAQLSGCDEGKLCEACYHVSQAIAAALRDAARAEREACAAVVEDTDVIRRGRDWMEREDATATLYAAARAIRARDGGDKQ